MENQNQNKKEKWSKNENSDAPKSDETKYVSEDKYLALEQDGVHFTENNDPSLLNSDDLTYSESDDDNEDENASNLTRLFDQDEAVLNTNMDWDSEENQSISNDSDSDS